MPRVLMVTSEANPFVKTGGLADVLGALPPALQRQGVEAAVVMPRYGNAEVHWAERVWHQMHIWMGPHYYQAAIDQVVIEGVRYFLVNCTPLYDRWGVYADMHGDFGDNHKRFALLSRAALEIARLLWRPDIIHSHDWPAGLTAAYLHHSFRDDPTFWGIKSLLTIHNLGYQGEFGAEVLADTGLDAGLFRADLLAHHGRVNFLKAGLVFSNALNTVSPTYAREIQTPEYGFGLDGLLRARAGSLFGILNGVDYRIWDPATDHHLPAPYSPGNLEGKAICKRSLMAEFGLSGDQNTPVIGMVTRFAYQKGLEFLGEALPGLLDLGARLVVLGSGERKYEDMFRWWAAVRPDRVGVRVGYDNALAHRITGGADMILMPSRYEPCGLNQIYGLRYGTLPLVRATGGLADTVQPGTGFQFWGQSGHDLYGAARYAIDAFADQENWRAMMRRAMSQDFSWDHSAKDYAALYRAILDLK
jgi:starch synthase